MPITFTPQSVGNLFGPGLAITLNTSVATLPSTANWQFQITEDTDILPGRTFHVMTQKTSSSAPVFIWDIPTGTQTEQDNHARPAAQATIRLNAQVFTDNSLTQTIDTGQGTAVFEPTVGLAEVVKANQGTGGFTENDRALQQQIGEATIPTINIDTTVPIVSAPSLPGGTVSAVMPLPLFGLIVRISSIPTDISPGTPDGDYFFPSLAVVRIFRDADLWLRVPVHTSTKVIPLFGENIQAAVANALALNWIAAMTYQVSFGPGVVGTVTEMHFP